MFLFLFWHFLERFFFTFLSPILFYFIFCIKQKLLTWKLFCKKITLHQFPFFAHEVLLFYISYFYVLLYWPFIFFVMCFWYKKALRYDNCLFLFFLNSKNAIFIAKNWKRFYPFLYLVNILSFCSSPSGPTIYVLRILIIKIDMSLTHFFWW